MLYNFIFATLCGFFHGNLSPDVHMTTEWKNIKFKLIFMHKNENIADKKLQKKSGLNGKANGQ